MTRLRFNHRGDFTAALLSVCCVFAVLLLVTISPARAAEYNRDRQSRESNGTVGGDRFADAFVMATYERTLNLLDQDDQSRRRAEGIVQRDYERMRRRQFTLDQLEQDARQAIKLHDEYPGAHFLLGYVRYEEGKNARSQRDYQSETTKMQEAHARYSAAIDLLRKQDDAFRELPVYYLYRINAAVALAYAVPQADQRSKLLEEAVQDARDSLKLDPRYAAHAYAAMGSALEKLAWMVEGNAEKFEKAVEAIEAARSKNPRNARYWVALGRCKYKAVEATVYQPNEKYARYLEDAGDRFRAVLDGDGQNFDRRLGEEEKAEVRYWLARVYFLQGKYAEAEEECQNVLSEAGEASGWRPLALETIADAGLVRAEAKDDPADAEARKFLQAVRDSADQLAAINPAEAARVRVQALLLERKPAEALDAIEKVLPPDGKQTQSLSEMRLRLIRDRLLLDDRWRNQLPKSKTPAEPQALVREADALAQSAGQFLALRGLAYANAGFAHLAAVTSKDESERPKAVAYLRQAVRFTLPDDRTGRRCRQELRKQEEILKKAAERNEGDEEDS